MALGSATDIARFEARRLIRVAQVAELCERHRRRLGAHASREEIAWDKKVSRRIAHMALTLARGWASETDDGKPAYLKAGTKEFVELQSIAATIDWKEYKEDAVLTLMMSIGKVDTWSKEHGVPKFGNRAISRYNVEIDRTIQALRGEPNDE